MRCLATDPVIRYLGIEQGLSNNAVRCIFQDHSGFMWFGTYDGLNRYDGYSFRVFRNKFNDSTSLVNNWITAMAEDSQFNLWIGTRQGISLYNPLSSNMKTVYFSPYGSKRREILTDQIMAITNDNDGNLFAGSEKRGLLFSKKGETSMVQVPLIDGSVTLTTYAADAVQNDSKGRIWVMVTGRGLYLYDQKAHNIKLVNNAIRNASCLQDDNEGNLWIGTNEGLYLYNIGTNSYIKHLTENAGSLSSNVVASIFLENGKDLWVATDGGGITILDINTSKARYLAAGNNNYSLTSEAVYAIYGDKQGRKWIGTLRGGVNIIDPNRSRFQTISYDPFNPGGLIGNFILSFCEEDNDHIWIGTDGAGLSVWDRKSNTFTNYRRNAAMPHSLNNNFVTTIRKDFQQKIWLGTYGGGINCFDKATRSFKYYTCIDPQFDADNRNIWMLYEDREKTLWAGCIGGATFTLNRTADRFERFDSLLTNILTMAEDSAGNLWAGDFEHLILVDKKKRKHTIYNIGKPVRAIYEDRRHNFWIGTEGGGLLNFNRATGRFTRYTDANGLCNNSVLNILEDSTGNIWMSTFNGISQFNITADQFRNYYQNDGLQSNQFNYNAALKLDNGELAFGGIKGFNVFNPAVIGNVNTHPVVLVTGIRVNNNPIDKDAPFVTRAGMDQVESIQVPYNKAALSFDFAALEYSAADKISYAYYLEGWDKDWNYTTSRTANYSFLREGKYTLWIKSTDADSYWAANKIGVEITVLPPWFRTWWAYTLYAVFAGALIFLFVYYTTRQNRLRYELKLAQVNAEKEREINEKRLSFFTNISHEFRTPLTLIINPIKDIIKKESKSEDDKALNVVYRNARRLLSLVDQLLIFRKADVKADNMKFSKYNFYDLCNEVYLCFVQQAKTNHLEYIFECASENIELYVDREKIEIALYNLISNAIKFTPDGGRVVFRVSESAGKVEVSVTDTGYGIPKEAAARLFEKFFQAQASNAPFKAGFGIGLYLTKYFVEAHKGNIQFKSEEGKGTRFTINLLKGKSHIDNYIIHETSFTEPILLQELAEEAAELVQENGGELITDRKTILLVDDDKAIRQYLKQALKDKYQVIEAPDADEAMKLSLAHFPDLIISDIKMGEVDGIEFCRRIKKDPSLNYIPVILLTGSYTSATELQSLESGADAYITKPFDKDILLVRIENIFKSRNELQEYFFNAITHRKNTAKVSPEYKDFLEKCILIVEKHLDDDQFTVKKLAQEIGMSHSNLYKKVKLISGQSISGFVRYIRLRKAAEILIKTDTNVNQVAFQVGISDIKYFRAHFFKLFGMNPSEYIKKYRTPFNDTYHKVSRKA
jgi:signal transduction histidine kinase/ligand-binding sensor domain-containing protein/DNA-binding response OmpR family regulator